MFVLDVNILVAAFRSDHPHHDGIIDWWTELHASQARFAVPDLVWVGFVRIVTNRRIFTVPASLQEAVTFVDTVRAQPGYSKVMPPDVISEWLTVCTGSDAGGDLVPDAYIAATAMTLGARVASRDRDFRRFDGLRVLDPGA